MNKVACPLFLPMVVVGSLLMIIGSMTGEFGIGIALLILGILYIGMGLCIINESAEPLRIALGAINGIIGAVFTILPGAGIFVASTLITLLMTFSGGGVQADNEIRRFCGERNL